MKNREKVRNHRIRKKKYYDDLEIENVELKGEIGKIKGEIMRLQSKLKMYEQNPLLGNATSQIGNLSAFEITSSLKSAKFKLNRNESYMDISLPKMIKENPDIVRYSMFVQNMQLTGPFGTDRVTCLKECFKTILENVLPFRYKAMLAVFDEFSLSKWIRFKNKYKNKEKENMEK